MKTGKENGSGSRESFYPRSGSDFYCARCFRVEGIHFKVKSVLCSFVGTGMFSLRSKQQGAVKFRGIVFLKFPAKFGLIFLFFRKRSLFRFFHLTSSPYYRIHTIPSITSINRFVLSYILQSAFLEVVIPPDIISEETSNDLMVPEGGSAKLVCKARGYPKPEIVWKREDGAEIISRAGLSGGKTKCEYNYTYYHIIIRSCSIFMLCDTRHSNIAYYFK